MANPDESRRSFLRTIARVGLVGGLGLAAAWLFRRNAKTGGTRDDACTQTGYCRACGALDSCGHPKADSARKLGRRS